MYTLAEVVNNALTVGLVIALFVLISIIASCYEKPPRR